MKRTSTSSGAGGSSDGNTDPDAFAGGDGVLVGTADGAPGDTAICIDEGLCEVPPVDSSSWCERDGGPVDLIYVDGVLVETICYPPTDDPERTVEEVQATSMGVDVVQMASGTTVVFDPATDGTPIEGDITIDGNRVAIYGNGPDNTIIDGNVELDGNATRLRGVTITGDLVIRKNRAAIVLTRVLGNLVLETESTNGSVIVENQIFGNFTSDSNGNLIVGNAVSGNFVHEGNGNTCDRNVAFTDADSDELLDEGELGETLACP